MSVKFSLLALLAEEPNHGYGLRTEFERRTGGSWPLNIGQVYTTLQRLERDGLVVAAPPTSEGQVVYNVTESGHAAATAWFTQTIERDTSQRDELPTKIAIAACAPGIRVDDVIQNQRTASMRVLQRLTQSKIQASATVTGSNVEGIGKALAMESQIFHVEAELRWLDHIQALLRATQPDSTDHSSTSDSHATHRQDRSRPR